MDDIADDAFSMEAGREVTKFMSIILTNLQINYDGWKAELPPEDREPEGKEEKEKTNDSAAEVRNVNCLCYKEMLWE